MIIVKKMFLHKIRCKFNLKNKDLYSFIHLLLTKLFLTFMMFIFYVKSLLWYKSLLLVWIQNNLWMCILIWKMFNEKYLETKIQSLKESLKQQNLRQAALRWIILIFLCRVIAYKIQTLLPIRDFEFQGMVISLRSRLR